jgi:hypothetical protein
MSTCFEDNDVPRIQDPNILLVLTSLKRLGLAKMPSTSDTSVGDKAGDVSESPTDL